MSDASEQAERDARALATRVLLERDFLADEALSRMTPLSDESINILENALTKRMKDSLLDEMERGKAVILRTMLFAAGDVFIATEEQGQAVDKVFKERDEARRDMRILAQAFKDLAARMYPGHEPYPAICDGGPAGSCECFPADEQAAQWERLCKLGRAELPGLLNAAQLEGRLDELERVDAYYTNIELAKRKEQLTNELDNL